MREQGLKLCPRCGQVLLPGESAHSCREPSPPPNGDVASDPRALAGAVHEAVADLNAAILDAYTGGLIVKAAIDIDPAGPREDRWPIVRVEVMAKL